MRVTSTYDRLRSKTARKVTCPGCNRERIVQKTFTETVNPFNRNEDGSVKTRYEVQCSVNAKAQAWDPSGHELYHRACWIEENARPR